MRAESIGRSKIRETSAMDGVPLAERRAQMKCGVAVVDCREGCLVALLEFQSAVEEIFDVQVLAGLRSPEVVGFQKEAIHKVRRVPRLTNAPTDHKERSVGFLPTRPATGCFRYFGPMQ
jgi:hypothetical protein